MNIEIVAESQALFRILIRSAKFILLFIALAFSLGCEKDCARRISLLKVYSVTNDQTSEPSDFDGWYHSEFQKGALNFSLEFTHTGAAGFCKYYWENYPDEGSIMLTCSKILFSGEDTLKAGTPLTNFFTTTKQEKDGQFICFLVSENEPRTLQFPERFYTFAIQINTSKGETLVDSCIVRLP